MIPGKQAIMRRRKALDDLAAAGYPRGSALAASLAPGPWPVSAQVYAVINPKRQRMVDFIAQRGG